MLGFSFFELFVIGMVALVVLGPEKLPRTARTIGALLGKAQRYVNDVKSEVNRAIDLEELKKMKSSVEDAARDVQSSFSSTANDFEKSWAEVTAGLDSSGTGQESQSSDALYGAYPAYMPIKKNWRLHRGRIPKWYKQQTRQRTQIQSGAARVARHKPK